MAELTYYTYILKCSDGSYYVGCTQDIDQRVQTHNARKGPGYTRKRLPVELAYSEVFNTLDEARQREIKIKKWTRAKKESLISGNLDKLKELSKSRTRRNSSVEGDDA